MLATKERPKNFDQVVGQDIIVKSLKKMSKLNRFAPVYIFEGNKGSGKTTLARIMAKAANCQHKDENGNPCCECDICKSIENDAAIDYIEIDAASNNGVENIRQVIDSVNYLPAKFKKKVIVLDEAHMLSTAGQNAFLKTLEEPPKHVMFLLLTTECNKLLPTITSRALTYTFSKIGSKDIIKHLKDVSKKYNVEISDDAACLIAKKSGGAMRDALTELDKCLLLGDSITAEDVSAICGISDDDTILQLISDLAAKRIEGVLKAVECMAEKGRDMKYVVDEALNVITDCLKLKNIHDESYILNTAEYISGIKKICDNTSRGSLAQLSVELMKIKNTIRVDSSKNTLLICFVQTIENLISLESLEERVNILEKIVSSGDIPIIETVTHNNTVEPEEEVERNDTIAGTTVDDEGYYSFENEPSLNEANDVPNDVPEIVEEPAEEPAVETIEEEVQKPSDINNFLMAMLNSAEPLKDEQVTEPSTEQVEEKEPSIEELTEIDAFIKSIVGNFCHYNLMQNMITVSSNEPVALQIVKEYIKLYGLERFQAI